MIIISKNDDLVETSEEDFPFSYVGHYGEEIQTSLFTAKIWPTSVMLRPGQHIYFRFRTRESLTGEFTSRLQLNFVTERSTVLGIQLVGETPERDREFIDKLCEIYVPSYFRWVEREDGSYYPKYDSLSEKIHCSRIADIIETN